MSAPIDGALPFDTIVVVLLQGRSFDHLLADMRGDVDVHAPVGGRATRYCVPAAGDDWKRSHVALETYDAAGRLLERHDLGMVEAGENRTVVPRAQAAGIVFYRLKITDPETTAERATLSGKIAFVK